jgi:hypothetical protein
MTNARAKPLVVTAGNPVNSCKKCHLYNFSTK